MVRSYKKNDSEKDKKKSLPDKPVLTNPKVDRLANDLVERKDAFLRERASQHEDTWEYGLKYYETRSPDPTFDWMSKAFLPLIYRDFRTIYPRLRKILLGPIPRMKVAGAPNENLEKYISESDRRSKGYLANSDILWESIMYGTGIGKVFWDTDYTTVEKRVPKITPGKQILERARAEANGTEDETLEYETKEDIIPCVDQPVTCWVPLWNFSCNGNESSDINNVDCCEEMYVDINYLCTRSKDPKLNPKGWKWGIYDNVDKIAADYEMYQTVVGVEDPQFKIRSVREESNLGDTRKFSIKLCCFQADFEYKGQADSKYKGQYYRNGIATIAQVDNGTVTYNMTLRVRACTRSDGRKNYFKINYERVPGRFYGRSLPQIMMSIQELINDFFRSQMNRDTMALHKTMYYDSDRVDSPEMLLLRMGGICPVRGLPREVVKEADIDPTHPSSWTVTNSLSEWGLELSGAYRNMAGQTDSSNRTLGGIQSLLNQSQERLMDTAREMAEGFTDAGDALIRTIKDNIKSGDAPKKIEFTYINNKGKEEDVVLTPEDIPEKVSIYIPTIFERVDKQQQANQIIQLSPMLLQNLDEENANALKKRVWKYLELEGEDELFQPSLNNIPLELAVKALERLGGPPELISAFGAALNQMAQQQAEGGQGAKSAGGGRQAAKPAPTQNQGSLNDSVPNFSGTNTGRTR